MYFTFPLLDIQIDSNIIPLLIVQLLISLSLKNFSYTLDYYFFRGIFPGKVLFGH